MLCSIGCAEKINQQILLALLEIVKISKIRDFRMSRMSGAHSSRNGNFFPGKVISSLVISYQGRNYHFLPGDECA